MDLRQCLFIIILISLPVVVLSHGWIVDPPTFNNKFATKDCNNAECTNACPRIEEPSEMANTPDKPAAIWSRGQLVRVCYTRNKHHGGIASFSLVPTSVMNSKDYHEQFTIFKTCWDAGKEDCHKLGLDCGTDPNFVFCREFHVPNNFPDGDYVMGYQWYGGLHFSRNHGHFPDFWSCSFVKIEGGSLECGPDSTHTPYFEPGGGSKVKNDKCHTSAERLGTCGNKGCPKKRAFYAKPFPFDDDFKEKNEKPQSFSCSDVEKAMREETAASNMLQGICQWRVCCPKTCGACGGKRCNRRTGGGENCCVSPILRAGRSCDNNPPPCIRPEYQLSKQ